MTTATVTEPRFHRPPAPPSRTVLQRMDALQRANGIRTYRARLKVDMKAGRVDVVKLLTARDLDPMIETMKVFDLLLAVPKTGRVKANKALRQCRMSPSKTIGGMSPRQRGELARWLHTHQPASSRA